MPGLGDDLVFSLLNSRCQLPKMSQQKPAETVLLVLLLLNLQGVVTCLGSGPNILPGGLVYAMRNQRARLHKL